MNANSHTPKCPRCGATLAADAPEGLCPRCLLALNLAPPTEIPGDEAGPHGTRVMRPPPPAPAEIAKHFPQLEILECLGRGGMGAVYKARQPRLDRFVALKILSPERQGDLQFTERFQREARALARLNHPNIVAIHDFGEAGGFCYLLMEFVDGVSLRQLIQSRKLQPEEALAIVPEICTALQFAHEKGIVHRDIKPDNILLDKAGQVKIADFGIAKILELGAQAVPVTPALSPSEAERVPEGRVRGHPEPAKLPLPAALTQDQVIGTPHYMAPEQIEHPLQVDHRADIYSLGVVFYEMLTGELPLGKFQPPSKKVQVDVRLDEVVLHALEKEPERRYQHASEVKSDVETIASGAASPVAESASAKARDDVKSPASWLVTVGILNWIAIPFIVFMITYARSQTDPPAASVLLPLLAVLFLSSAIIFAGLKMKRLEAYSLAIIGSILAIFITPGNIIGLPIGIWSLVVLLRREVREAFEATRVRIAQAGSKASSRGLARGLCLGLGAIATIAGILVVVLPHGPQSPNLTVSGVVTDAATGQPIRGARVADLIYAGSPTREPQAAWTDGQGRYSLPTWYEEHTIAASAPGYKTKLATLVTKPLGREREVRMDFQLQPTNASPESAESPRLRALRARLADLRQTYIEESPRVLGLLNEIAKLERSAQRPPPQPPFSQVAEQIIGTFGDTNACLDLDTGKVFNAPKNPGARDWDALRKWGVDLCFNPMRNEVFGLDLFALRWDADAWDLPAVEVATRLSRSGVEAGMRREVKALDIGPITYAFRTREGAVGLLQLHTWREQSPDQVKVRYKLVQLGNHE